MVSFYSHKRTFISVLAIAAISLSSIAFADTLGPITPTADGFYLQWTPKTGSTHYTMVDEATCNGTTDYNRTTTVGARDSYVVSLGSVPDGSIITQISITPCASKNNNGGSNSTMNVFYRFSGVNSADAGSYSLAGTTPVALATTNFTSLSHLKSSTSTLEIGAVLSAGNKGARLGRIAVQITYAVLNAPSGLTATPSGTQVTLSWTDNSTIEDGFKIERQTGGTGSFVQIGTVGVNVTNFTDTTPVADTTYTYRVRAYNSAADSAYSNTATASMVPNAPFNFVALSSGTQVQLIWTDTSDVEAGVKIERSTDGVNFTQIDTVGANVTTYMDTTTVADMVYWYRARAHNAAGNSPYSSTSSATTAPNAPSNLFAYASGPLVYLTWTDHSQVEQGFEIERSSDGVNFAHIVSTAVNSTGYTDSGSVANTNYWYRVRAFNAAGPSAYSNTETVGTIPAAPSNLTTTPNGGGVVILNWVDNAFTELYYHVERKTSGTGSFVQIGGFLSPNTTTYPDYAGSGEHTYRVRTSNDAGFSEYSNESTITLP